MKGPINICWFRRDLRIHDHHAFYEALQSGKPVLPIFIFDTDILYLLENKLDRRVDFIHQEVEKLKHLFESKGSSFYIQIGNPLDVFKKLLSEYEIENVYTNHDYEPYGMKRDQEISDFLNSQNVSFKTYKDIVIFEKGEVTKDDGNPYTVYTPYSKKWKFRLQSNPLEHYPSENLLDRLFPSSPLPFPSLDKIGFMKTDAQFPSRNIDLTIIEKYHLTRDFPALLGTSKLSIHLRFGIVSIRELVKAALQTSEKWLNELIWRDFYQSILYHFPYVVNGAFKKEYDCIAWENREDYFEKWCQGKTGFPIVDAGMRELNETGYMHNRVRMIVSSFLTKDLLIDWRWGEAYFAEKLLDFELASNNGGWQWAAGCGVDAAPYFRVFNPTLQTLKFDPKLAYIKKWVPEFQSLEYPQPIVNHADAKKKMLEVFQKAVSKKNLI